MHIVGLSMLGLLPEAFALKAPNKALMSSPTVNSENGLSQCNRVSETVLNLKISAANNLLFYNIWHLSLTTGEIQKSFRFWLK